MAVTRAPKSKAKSVKKVANKSVKSAKKSAPAKKAAKKVETKVPLKKELTAVDVKQILDARDLAERQKFVLAELEKRGVKSIHRIPKKTDKELVDEARALEISEIGRAHV